MRVEIKKGYAKGSLRVPPSKSCAHRLLLGAALADGVSTLRSVDFNEDILATIDCIKSVGINVVIEKDYSDRDRFVFITSK
jgi:3-phosphoshikimate 1-carboxyvinyltransferase